MKSISYLFKVCLIFIVLLSFIAGLILYVRPDIKPYDFLSNWKFWIIPVVLFYFILNFKRLIAKTINRFLLVAMIVWGGYFFYPNIMDSIKPYVLNYFGSSSEKIKGTVNDLVTPKDGSKPIIHIPSSSKSNSDVKVNSVDISSKDDISKNLPGLSSSQIKDLAQQPLSYLSSLADLTPPEVKNRLAKIGIDVKHPSQSISDLVGGDNKKQREAINNLFK